MGKCTIYKPEYVFGSCDQVDEIIDQLHLSNCIPNVNFNFILCPQEI